MPKPNPGIDATAYREAVSQWQLAARTEVKRSSSLPSSMFEACDPMLEARLADSVQTMMQSLHVPAADDRFPKASGEHQRVSFEQVSREELEQLPAKLAEAPTEQSLDDGLSTEFLNVLVDVAVCGTPTPRLSAHRLLERDWAAMAHLDLEDAAAQLLRTLEETSLEHIDDEQQQRLRVLSESIAAAVVVQGYEASRQEDE